MRRNHRTKYVANTFGQTDKPLWPNLEYSGTVQSFLENAMSFSWNSPSVKIGFSRKIVELLTKILGDV